MASGTLRTAWNSGSRWIATGRPDRSGKGEDIMADRADNGIRKQDNYGTADCANIIAPDGEYEQMEPLDKAAGFRIRPGLYGSNGATALPGAVNFTVHSHGAYSCELLLYHRMENSPYAVIPFPENYRVGKCLFHDRIRA